MTTKEVALELAAFCDSAAARAASGPKPAELRRIAEAFLELCYDVGKAPHLVDAEDVRAVVAEALPARFARRDPLAQHVPAVLEALFDHLEAEHVVAHAFEARRALGPALAAFARAVESGAGTGAAAPGRQEPLVHRAPKLGRNDPCFCGSGKKFKKCHGREEG